MHHIHVKKQKLDLFAPEDNENNDNNDNKNDNINDLSMHNLPVMPAVPLTLMQQPTAFFVPPIPLAELAYHGWQLLLLRNVP
jgi:hypothetical protein